MKVFIAAMLFAMPCFAAQPLLQLSSNATNYAVGATAHLDAVALVTPEKSSDDFYIGATLNGANIPVIESTNGRGLTLATMSAAGTYTWAVQLYLEDSVFAAQLNSAVSALNLQNAQITTELSQTTNPTTIASLQAQQAQNNALITQANNELALIRTPFGPSQSITFTAQ